jgi:hypothetical protein
MRWSDIPRNPTSRTLRQFGALCLLFFSAVALWEYFHEHRPVAAVAAAVAALTLGPVGLLRPKALRHVFVAWMVAAFPIGWLVSHLLLAVAFYGLFTPVGLVFRVIGRDSLSLRRSPTARTYWREKPTVTDVTRYFRQF